MRHLVPIICVLLGGCLSRPGYFDDENNGSDSTSGFDESGGDEDESESGDGDYDVGELPKFDVLFVPDAPEEEPELPQCIVVPKCSDELDAQADCPDGTHCVADPDPGHCEPNQDNSMCTCGGEQCGDDQLCTWSDMKSWYACA